MSLPMTDYKFDMIAICILAHSPALLQMLKLSSILCEICAGSDANQFLPLSGQLARRKVPEWTEKLTSDRSS